MEGVRSGEGVSGEPVDGATIEQLAAGERMSTQTYAIEPEVTVSEHSHEYQFTRTARRTTSQTRR
jgi:hypothetical protein